MYPANAYIYVHKLELDSHILPQYLENQFLHIDILFMLYLQLHAWVIDNDCLTC